jgi:hypothetical protein
MAGDWIKMRKDLREDPAVILISDSVGLDEDAVVGKLHRIWCWADSQLRDGNAHSVTQSWLDRFIGVTGFAQAMQRAGWLVVSDDGLSFPNFDRHNGQTAKARALTSSRVRQHRLRKCNAPSVTESLPEKRREENKRERARATFTPPTTEQVAAFASEHSLQINATAFVDHYTSNGWCVGRSGMKDWKAAVRRWVQRQSEFESGRRDETIYEPLGEIT